MATRHIQTTHYHDDYKVQREFERASRGKSSITLRTGQDIEGAQPGVQPGQSNVKKLIIQHNNSYVQGDYTEILDFVDNYNKGGVRWKITPQNNDEALIEGQVYIPEVDVPEERWALTIRHQYGSNLLVTKHPFKRIQDIRFADNDLGIGEPLSDEFTLPTSWSIYSQAFTDGSYGTTDEINEYYDPYNLTQPGERPKWMKTEKPGWAKVALSPKMRAWTYRTYTNNLWYLSDPNESENYKKMFNDYNFTNGYYSFYGYNEKTIDSNTEKYEPYDVLNIFSITNQNDILSDLLHITAKVTQGKLIVTAFIKIYDILNKWHTLLPSDLQNYITNYNNRLIIKPEYSPLILINVIGKANNYLGI